MYENRPLIFLYPEMLLKTWVVSEVAKVEDILSKQQIFQRGYNFGTCRLSSPLSRARCVSILIRGNLGSPGEHSKIGQVTGKPRMQLVPKSETFFKGLSRKAGSGIRSLARGLGAPEGGGPTWHLA